MNGGYARERVYRNSGKNTIPNPEISLKCLASVCIYQMRVEQVAFEILKDIQVLSDTKGAHIIELADMYVLAKRKRKPAHTPKNRTTKRRKNKNLFKLDYGLEMWVQVLYITMLLFIVFILFALFKSTI